VFDYARVETVLGPKTRPVDLTCDGTGQRAAMHDLLKSEFRARGSFDGDRNMRHQQKIIF
jgi:hypothetical protein